MSLRLTVCFDDPFWVGVIEQSEEGSLATARVVFGAEPKDCEVYAWFLAHYRDLVFSQPLAVEPRGAHQVNPKRLQRQVRRETTGGIGTKAQQAIKLECEARVTERKRLSKAAREERDHEQYEKRRLKKKEKLKGH